MLPTPQELLARLRQVKMRLPVIQLQLPVGAQGPQTPPAPSEVSPPPAPAEKGGKA